jgi:hypothetical protein
MKKYTDREREKIKKRILRIERNSFQTFRRRQEYAGASCRGCAHDTRYYTIVPAYCDRLNTDRACNEYRPQK